ncbi:unnamed protein product [Closterium sp. NIES-65]|nr:unnamed protein product [Closterium sp. NIES-65]
MQSATHINDLPNDVLARILWQFKECTSWNSDSDALWSRLSLWPKPQYLSSVLLDEDSDPEEETTPISTPSAAPNTARIFLISSVCRRWRDLAKRDVSTLRIERNHVVSLQDLSNAVACFPNLTHLHLCDGSVENLDDTFLAHLASSCPKLTILHVGRRITQHPDYVGSKHDHPITDAGLDRFFQQCTQLEQLSLLCLHRNAELPPSFFHLTRLHTLALTVASALGSPDLESLSSLTALHIASAELTSEQLSNVRRLRSVTRLSISVRTRFPPANTGSAAFTIAQLPFIKSLETSQMLRSDWPCTSLERLHVSDCRELQRLPDDIAELLPRLRELTICRCDLFQELPAAGFCCLMALTTLCLGQVALPADIGRLSNLQTLLVRDSCQQRYLPSSLTDISSLTRLELGLCGVERLPEGVGELSNLRELHISSCSHLTAVPASVTRLTRLEALTFSDCRKLAFAPTRLDGLTRLKQLEVASCDMLKYPPLLLPVSLETLSWGSYRHAMVLPDVSRLTGLRTLCLDRVAVACDGLAVGRRLSHLQHLMLTLADDSEELPFPLTFLSQLRTLIVHGMGRYGISIAAAAEAEAEMCGGIEGAASECECAAEPHVLPEELSELKGLQRLDVQGCGHVIDTDGSVLPRSVNQMYGLKIFT